jgi:hypothetical protein
VRPRSWRIRDAVFRLRERGTTDRVYGLPVPPVACRMGTSSDLELQLHDPSGTVSREHVELVPIEVDRERAWKVHDLESKNGLLCDGEPRRACVLRPGVELRLGSLRLIAESAELVGVLSVVRRCLGWAADRQEHVDQALQDLRDWAAQRAEMIVVGDGDLRPVVRRWHDLVIGKDVPFTWHKPAARSNAAAAVVKEAGAGTLCVDTTDRQKEALAVVERVHGTEYPTRPQLLLCTPDPTSAATLKGSLKKPAVIHVPPLASRAGEMADIVQEYAQEIAREKGLPGPELEDVEQLSRWPFRNLAEVEDDALRLVTLRRDGLRPGAARLGMGYSTFRSWKLNRGLK